MTLRSTRPLRGPLNTHRYRIPDPSHYANWNSDTEATVVFPGKIFRYPRGDQAGREQALAHGRSVGVPEPQLDWTD